MVGRPLLGVVLVGAVVVFTGGVPLPQAREAGAAEATGCANVSGKIFRGNQSGMTAVASTQSSLRVGSKVRVTASDGDHPAGGRSVVVTITGKSDLLPGGVCLDLASEAWKLFEPEDAAYRHANITALSDR